MEALLAQPQAWAVLLGVLAPLLISVAQRPEWSGRGRRIVAVAVSFVIGAITLLASGQFNPGDAITTLALLLAASEVAYRKVWQPTGVAASIEVATTPRGALLGDEDFEVESPTG